MITVVVGHRGTGKSELMKRLQFYYRDESVAFVDLDVEIEQKIGCGIREYFLQHGESYFREVERQLFLECLQKPHNNLYLVVGAGFDLGVIPENVCVLWVRRQTDPDGRIFLDRPRLNPDVSPLEEFWKRARIREKSYAERADMVYLMPEGLFDNRHQAMAMEKSILTFNLKMLGGALTLLPAMMSSSKRWELFRKRFSAAGVGLIELRDDFLSEDQIRQAVQDLSEEVLLFSFRKERNWSEFFSNAEYKQILSQVQWIDWAIELGAPDPILEDIPSDKIILSLHENKYRDVWQKYEAQVAHMKYAPIIESFTDLYSGHKWQEQKSGSRSFLPRSPNGRWEWYRRLQKGRQLINFWREGEGSALDQPSLWSWLMTPTLVREFAAVIGDPVYHSHTPMEQSDFFHKKSMPVFSISILRGEWNEAFPILRELGLSYAAVTAPHKEIAAAICESGGLRAVNTLYWDFKQKKWLGTSTDDLGFSELIEGIGMLAPLQKEIFVWGGGGVLEMIEKFLPHASYFSARTGEPRSGSEDALQLIPKIVIWAAPRSPETKLPPRSWSPAMVLDLNYKEDSMGREYAQFCGGNYRSGLVMFTGQAQGQRMFWRKAEENT